MTTLTVYDPAMCCSTGICGAEVDQNLVDFAANLDWLKSQGVAVTRINLSQEPTLFAENELVKTILATSGVDALPVIMVDDQLRTSGHYPARSSLADLAGVKTNGAAMDPAQSTGCCGGDESAEKTTGCC